MQAPDDFNPQTVSLLRHGLLFGLAFHPEMSVYDDLKNSGELALLTSPALREALSSMEAGLEQLQYFQADLTTVQQLNIDSYMIDHMDLMSFYGEMLGMQLSDDELRADLGFIADTEFRNRVLLKLDLVTQLEMVIATAESRVIAVKQNIEAELEQR